MAFTDIIRQMGKTKREKYPTFLSLFPLFPLPPSLALNSQLINRAGEKKVW